MANPVITKHTDLPTDERGRIRTRADLRVGSDDEIVEGAWAAGDISAVPDLTGGGVGGFCVPNAQHAVRQGKLLAKNIAGSLRGEEPKNYEHKNMGAVATLGLGVGAFQSGKISVKGFPAWVMHRGYHGLAMPSWERKFRVVGDWWSNFWLGRNETSLSALTEPRRSFEEFASRPRPAAPEAVEAAPSADAEKPKRAPRKKAAPKLDAAASDSAPRAVEAPADAKA